MAWTRLTDRQTAYAEWVLDTHFEEQKPAIIDRNVITFVGEDGRSEFLDALRDEMDYDRSCGRAGRIAPRLLTKIEEMY
jgi:hypothetical protein